METLILFKLLLGLTLLRLANWKNSQKHSVQTNGSFNYVRSVVFIAFWIEILQFLTRKFFMTRQIKISSRVYSFQLFESKRKTKFDIRSRIGIRGLIFHGRENGTFLLPFPKPNAISFDFFHWAYHSFCVPGE